MTKLHSIFAAAALMLAGAFSTAALAAGVPEEAAIRKSLEKLGDFPKVDEVSKGPMPGLFEVRVGTELFYTDAQGGYIIVGGQIVEVANRKNHSSERVSRLTAIDFKSLPLKDAIVSKRGDGKRKIAVFADPNCGYCKKLEQELTKVDNVTVYTFLFPILGEDSHTKAAAIWCSKDQDKTFVDWMTAGVQPPAAPADCQTPVDRNVELGRSFKIAGTPAIVFEDDARVPGMLTADQLEKRFAAIKP